MIGLYLGSKMRKVQILFMCGFLVTFWVRILKPLHLTPKKVHSVCVGEKKNRWSDMNLIAVLQCS